MSENDAPLRFGPASGTTPDLLTVDLNDLFADSFYPENMDFTDILKDFQHLDNDGVPSEQATAAANAAAAAAASSSSSSSSSNQSGHQFGEKTIGDIAGGHTHCQDLEALFDGDFGDKVVSSVGQKRAAAAAAAASSSSSSRSRGGTTTSAHGVITVPPTLPSHAPVPAAMGGRSGIRGGNNSSNVSNFNMSSHPFQDPFEQEGISMRNGSNNNYRDDDDDDDEEEDEEDYDRGRSNRRKKQRTGSASANSAARGADPDSLSLTEQQKLERRERNREHAKRSRIRKKVLLDLLQDQLSSLRAENVKLRQVIGAKVPAQAAEILARCTTEESMLLVSDEEGESARENDDDDDNNNTASGRGGDRDTQPGDRRSRRQTLSFRDGGNDGMGGKGDDQGGQAQQQHARVLMEPDFRLIQALCGSQQNFVLSDPSLPDNPIVYCSEGFCKITGYKRHQVIGRNCRFLQGPGTDQNAVDIIRKGVAEGKDISVCLLNYKANGTPFWNQFFVAPLKDADGAVVNYVGVQCEVNIPPISKIKDRVKRLPIDG